MSAPRRTLYGSWRVPDQRSLHDQLTDTAELAEKAGMYDAADYLRSVVQASAARLRDQDATRTASGPQEADRG